MSYMIRMTVNDLLKKLEGFNDDYIVMLEANHNDEEYDDGCCLVKNITIIHDDAEDISEICSLTAGVPGFNQYELAESTEEKRIYVNGMTVRVLRKLLSNLSNKELFMCAQFGEGIWFIQDFKIIPGKKVIIISADIIDPDSPKDPEYILPEVTRYDSDVDENGETKMKHTQYV